MNEQTKEWFVRKENLIAPTAGVATGKFWTAVVIAGLVINAVSEDTRHIGLPVPR